MSLTTLFQIGGFITQWWWAFALLLLAIGLFLQFALGIRVLRILEAVVEWFTRKPEGRVAGVALILFFVGSSVFQWGMNVARKECEADALRSQLAAVRLERDLALARADRDADRAADLEAMRGEAAGEISRLEAELAGAKLQSTQQGAKHDPQALLDDQCRLTRRGADVLRRR